MKQLMGTEGVRLDGSTPDEIRLDMDFTRDDINDVINLSPPDDNVWSWRTQNPKVLVYRAFSFNPHSKYFKDVGDKREKLEVQDRIRRIMKDLDKSAMNYPKFLYMIDKSIDKFDALGKDLSKSTNLSIVPMPSKSQLNNLIIQRIQRKFKNILSYDLFKKAITDDVVLNMDKINNEMWARTNKEKIVRYFNSMKKANQGNPYEVKFVNTGFRRYITNFLIFKDDPSKKIFKDLINGNILFVDDTIGNGNTLKDMIRLIRSCEFYPELILCYAFLNDFSKVIK